jgi:hypothetical protein
LLGQTIVAFHRGKNLGITRNTILHQSVFCNGHFSNFSERVLIQFSNPSIDAERFIIEIQIKNEPWGVSTLTLSDKLKP